MGGRGTRWLGRLGLVALVAAATTVGVAAPAGTAPSILVTPDTGLVDGQLITVTGSGWDPNQRMEIFECRAAPVDETDCDLRNAYEFDANPAGEVHFVFKVDARIYVEGDDFVEVDCRAAPGTCVMGLGYAIDADEGPLAPLTFDPTAPLLPPVSMTVTPSTGLVDGQVLTVQGANLTDREESWVYQCLAGQPHSGATCDFGLPDVRGVAGPDGNLTLEWAAKATLFPPLGGAIDCTTGPGVCELVLSWSFLGSPDRVARTPLAFGAEPPPTTAPPTTTPPTTAPAPTTAPTFTG